MTQISGPQLTFPGSFLLGRILHLVSMATLTLRQNGTSTHAQCPGPKAGPPRMPVNRPPASVHVGPRPSSPDAQVMVISPRPTWSPHPPNPFRSNSSRRMARPTDTARSLNCPAALGLFSCFTSHILMRLPSALGEK
ncbi:unnamed protein product [Rangifer tarandus platyrhynchus]|uniref:Uncharacterized protein n=1 Tax=Rangifer tarandus platyrhynchus TaxID=3082113 RepID=A0ABN8YHB1_RANTA|nr:unnamed protein product [Rangifer tarandus platyrhynchus]